MAAGGVIEAVDAGAVAARPAMRSCRACGYQFSHSAHGDCCSGLCAAYLAAGGLSKADQLRADDPFQRRPERFGKVGCVVTCAGCGLSFESRGLRLCPDCYLALGDKDDLRRYGGSAAERPVKRAECPVCGGPLPARALTGKKSKARYCSARCKQRASKAAENGGQRPFARPDDGTLPPLLLNCLVPPKNTAPERSCGAF